MNLVFASGFLVPQRLHGLEYFRGLAAAFPGALFPAVSPTGTVEDRARSLADQIATAFPSGPIHVIAHSMGGLDARFLISNNLRGLSDPDRIIALSTIATPHRGSAVADLVVGNAPDPLDPRRFIYDTLHHALSDLGVPAGALGDLTTGFAASFNAKTPDIPHVQYLSYSGAGMNSFILKPGHVYLNLTGQTPEDKTNDGLVTVASAKWGTVAEPSWAADHLAEVGYDLSIQGLCAPFDHLAAFRRVVARVQQAAHA